MVAWKHRTDTMSCDDLHVGRAGKRGLWSTFVFFVGHGCYGPSRRVNATRYARGSKVLSGDSPVATLTCIQD